jgi:uncharacterized protein
MSHLRRSQRVTFEGGSGFSLSGILDQPQEMPKAFVVFTHCFTCTKDLKLIVRISRALAGFGFGVLRYDLTGLGNSSGDFSKTNFTTNREDLRAAVSFVSEHYAPPAFLIGHSFGGAVSLSLSEELPSIQSVVSIAAPSNTFHLAALLERKNPRIMQDGRGEVQIGATRHIIDRQMIDNFRNIQLNVLLGNLRKPVFLMHSPSDETLGFEHALQLYQMLSIRGDGEPSSCPTSLVCLDGADHLLANNPSDLEFISRMIAAWFDRQLSSEHNILLAGSSK